MTGIPDAVVELVAEALADNICYRPTDENGHADDDAYYDHLARAALAAAEGPWREHLATQIEAATLNVDRVLAEKAERMVALIAVKHQIVRIVRGTNETR